MKEVTLVDALTVTREIWTSTVQYAMETDERDGLGRPEAPVTYIAPRLRVIKHENNCSIIIVSAPGAVGKTTFAKRLAFDKKGLYWDLSLLKLGDNSFIGTVAKVFGSRKLSDVVSSISKGELSICFDAFDEAEIISGWEGVETFVKDIFRSCTGSSHPNLIFFSRSETAEFLQMKLEELGGANSYSMYEIDYFDHDGSVQFVKEYLRSKGDTEYDNHRVPFEKAIEAIFTAIGSGIDSKANNIWTNSETRSFVGYSPVLQTIGSFLFDSNYEEVFRFFEEKRNSLEGMEVIAEFIERLLLREQEKIVVPLKGNIRNVPKEWDGWTELYSPGEQVKALITYLANGRRINPKVHADHVPDWMLSEYVSSVSQFLPNHPFLRAGEFNSPAFRDYCIGKMLMFPYYEDSCKKYLDNGRFVLTPLFAFFYNRFHNGQCRGPHVGHLYESVAARLGLEDSRLFTFIKETSSKKYAVDIVNSDGAKASNLHLDCHIDELDPLVFERRLHHATIDIDQELVLGREGGAFELFDVDISAKKIRLRGKEFHLNCSYDSDISMMAKDCLQEDHSLILHKTGNGNVRINWPNGEVFPWSDYYQKFVPSNAEGYDDELYALKMILSPFRKHGRGDFAKHYEFIEKAIVKDHPIRTKMLAYLVNLKVLAKNPSDHQYHFDEEKLNQYGINWSDLKALALNPKLISFLNKYRLSIK
ncbi:MAG: hypothetical protein JST46_10455 [Bacteroidetes bacterium]|nr:hypothetical protein [Bacteroidota bacterium]